MKNERKWTLILVCIVLIVTFLSISTGNLFGKRLNIQIGDISPQDFYAPFRIENTVATERKEDQALLMLEPIYIKNENIKENAQQEAKLLFNYAISIKDVVDKEGMVWDIPPSITKHFNISLTPIEPAQVLRSKSTITLLPIHYETLMLASREQLVELEERAIFILEEFFSLGLHESDILTLDIQQKVIEAGVIEAYQPFMQDLIRVQLSPNMQIDFEATKTLQDLALSTIEPVYVVQGEKIIDRGSKITDEVYILLQKAGEIDNSNAEYYLQYVGVAILIIILFSFSLYYIKESKVIEKLAFSQQSLLFIVYIFMVIVVRLLIDLPYIYIPLNIAPMLIVLLIEKDIAIWIHIILVMLSTIIHNGDLNFVTYHLMSGIISVLIITNMQERKQMIRCASFIGVAQATVHLSLCLLIGMPLSGVVITETFQAFGVGLLCVVIVIGSLPFWESTFKFVTPLQLLELTNPNQPLLKRLLLEATGTYYHSLLVANIAEAAADEIGANPLLTRVGGYYHDIGKLTCSNYFKENQVLDNPHDHLDPRSSAGIIVSHVTSGLELATEYNLPQCVKDMIIQHHGKGVMQYFYVKAQNMEGENVRLEDFQYPGPRPQTKEAALVMLADVVEATVRSMQHKLGPDLTVEDVVKKMIKQKLDEGELSECPLYISDINKITQSFTKMLNGMYHERIEYPEKNVK
ncbi:MAG: hypothetical protein ATN36_05295 [Epulopiscium sp. Nele67-Bin005]|nr:MAG: hypothetical protein ATN36_05295 [Epulopiscium sp. Nele67-Bin005]